jgi:hypothetical protein
MKRPETCRLLEDAEFPCAAELPPELERHAVDCVDCVRVLARQRRLEALLETGMRAPQAGLPVPSLQAEPAPGILRTLPRWVIPAAAALLAAVTTAAALHRDPAARTEPAPAVYVGEVVDLPDAPPPADERLLALTDGVEAVAMRRPAEGR